MRAIYDLIILTLWIPCLSALVISIVTFLSLICSPLFGIRCSLCSMNPAIVSKCSVFNPI